MDEYIERLQKCGMTRNKATCVCCDYVIAHDMDGLKAFVELCEILQKDRSD